jgi:hypothetical protein
MWNDFSYVASLLTWLLMWHSGSTWHPKRCHVTLLACVVRILSLISHVYPTLNLNINKKIHCSCSTLFIPSSTILAIFSSWKSVNFSMAYTMLPKISSLFSTHFSKSSNNFVSFEFFISTISSPFPPVYVGDHLLSTKFKDDIFIPLLSQIIGTRHGVGTEMIANYSTCRMGNTFSIRKKSYPKITS